MGNLVLGTKDLRKKAKLVNSIGTSNINPIRMFNAVNAFKAAQAPVKEDTMQDVSEGLEISEDSLLKNQNLEEIKQFAKTAGEENISDEDIKYGITYGRSVIADYVA